MSITPFGIALRDLYRGQQQHPFIIERDDGHGAELPLARFIESSGFTPLEELALKHCEGRVLDVGAGGGRHSLELQRRGLEVHALEQDEHLVWIMKERGIQRVIQADIFSYAGSTFDTIVMLGHGLGNARSIAGLHILLNKLSQLLSPGGRILADSIDIGRNTPPEHLAYFEAQRQRNRYPGEMSLKMMYGPDCQMEFEFLHVEPEMLLKVAEPSGWHVELLARDGYDYLASLSRAAEED